MFDHLDPLRHALAAGVTWALIALLAAFVLVRGIRAWKAWRAQ